MDQIPKENLKIFDDFDFRMILNHSAGPNIMQYCYRSICLRCYINPGCEIFENYRIKFKNKQWDSKL